MKIYFTTSARGNTKINDNCSIIYNWCLKKGFTHLDNYKEDMSVESIYDKDSYDDKKKRYLDAVANIKKADIVILEVSTHSLTMGFLMNYALSAGKPVIALHEVGNPPAFAEGVTNQRLQIWEYTNSDIYATLNEAITIAKKDLNIRFNLFLNSHQYKFLQDQAQKRKISKSIIIRDLIEK